MVKKWIALLLAMMMVLSLAACGTKENADQSQGKEDTKVETSTDDKADDKADDKTEDTTEDEGPATPEPGVHLPVTEEKVTFDMWVTWSKSYQKDPNECLSEQELERRTNVHINYICNNSTEAGEKFGLMIASGDIPDMVRLANGNTYYAGGMAKAIDDGVFREVTEEVKLYMPNYLETIYSNPEAVRGHVNDEGRNLVVYTTGGNDYELKNQKTYLGLMIRQDWLDKCGLAMPETIEDWHTTLTAFKEQMGADAPLYIGNNGKLGNGEFLTAFGVAPAFYNEDGVVKYGPAEPGYKEYLDTFRQWYAEGLIDPNFSSSTPGLADNAYLATGRSGAGYSLFIFGGPTFLQWGMSQDADLNYVAAPMPVLNKGDAQKSSYNGSRIVGDYIAFSADIENLEVALKWLDYGFTDEAMALNNYGIEGDSYVIDEEGPYRYKYTDKIMANPDYSPSDAHSFYCPRIPMGKYSWAYEEQFYSPEILHIEDVWSEADNSIIIPPEVTLTEEEANIYSSKYASIETLVNELTVKYIMGTVGEEAYEGFVDQLYQYGLQDCLDVQQAGFTRYMNRLDNLQ